MGVGGLQEDGEWGVLGVAWVSQVVLDGEGH